MGPGAALHRRRTLFGPIWLAGWLPYGYHHHYKPNTTLDFVIGLFKTDDPIIRRNYDIIITIVNKLIKYVKFILYRTNIDTR